MTPFLVVGTLQQKVSLSVILADMTITLITGNLKKLQELQRFTSLEIDHAKIDLPEIQSLDPAEVVRVKAEAAYAALGRPVLVDDTSVVFPSLGRLPGPFIKWFLDELQPEGLCRLVDSDPERKAIATVTYGLHDGQNVTQFSGSLRGTVSQHPEGENGFGWDSIFIPEGRTKTRASMTPEEQAGVSIRQELLQELEAWVARNSTA